MPEKSIAIGSYDVRTMPNTSLEELLRKVAELVSLSKTAYGAIKKAYGAIGGINARVQKEFGG